MALSDYQVIEDALEDYNSFLYSLSGLGLDSNVLEDRLNKAMDALKRIHAKREVTKP